MTAPTEPQPSLFAIFARQAPIAALFLERPGTAVQLVVWNLLSDTFEMGQTCEDKIFVRRCDLSPDGTKLLYFAAQSIDHPYDPSLSSTWSAVSRLPFFAPIALWPKGDRLAGGGLFHDDKHIWLNHRPHAAKLHESYSLPATVFINPNPYAAGEDYPIYANRLERDGWRYKQHGDFRQRAGGWFAESEEICVKSDASRRYEIEMTLYGIEKRTTGSIFKYRFLLRDTVSGQESNIDCDDWAEWDCCGRLVYSKGGKLYVGFGHPGARIETDPIVEFVAQATSSLSAPPATLCW